MLVFRKIQSLLWDVGLLYWLNSLLHPCSFFTSIVGILLISRCANWSVASHLPTPSGIWGKLSQFSTTCMRWWCEEELIIVIRIELIVLPITVWSFHSQPNSFKVVLQWKSFISKSCPTRSSHCWDQYGYESRVIDRMDVERLRLFPC